jgi:hypothetical protein
MTEDLTTCLKRNANYAQRPFANLPRDYSGYDSRLVSHRVQEREEDNLLVCLGCKKKFDTDPRRCATVKGETYIFYRNVNELIRWSEYYQQYFCLVEGCIANASQIAHDERKSGLAFRLNKAWL